jgi:methyl-accepting chemotaxis protein
VPETLDLIADSFQRLSDKGESLTSRFVKGLLKGNPHVLAYFEKQDLPALRARIMVGLTALARHANDEPALRMFSRQLGSRHAKAGVDPIDFSVAASVLLQVFANLEGEFWSEEAQNAWEQVLNFVVREMRCGADVELPDPHSSQNLGKKGTSPGESEDVLNNHSRPSSIASPQEDAAAQTMENKTMLTSTIQENGTESSTRAGVTQETNDLGFMAAMIEKMPINVIMANTDLVITYVNPASVKQLQSLEQFLPVKVSEVLGQNIDIFHKNPAHQRGMLSNPANLPHRAQIQLGPETLDLLVSPVSDENGTYLGPMVTWEVVTEKLRIENEMVRVQNMMENIPINVMMANEDFDLVYMNPASVKTLTPLQHLLPKPLDQLMGQKIDIFHKDPEHQRRFLSDPSNLPHKTQIKLAEHTLNLLVSPIYDKNNDYVGPMVTWDVVTDQIALAENLKNVVEAVSSSATELQASSRSMATTSDETSRQSQVVAAASEEATKNVETVSSAAEELSASISEIAQHVQQASSMTSQAVEEARTTNLTIKDLGESSNEIGQVVKVITSIAQQTNLLALNATIEAARAGEAGKGFAVVANEVKELARQTAKATEEISQKINAIQSSTTGAAEAVGSIGESIEKINEIATTIASAVEEQTAATNEISRNVTEAAKGTAEVSSNIVGVSQASEEAGKGANDVMSASEGLAKEAAKLDEMTVAFIKQINES